MDPERLSGLPLYADLDDGARTEIAGCTREVAIAAGATVATQGDNAYEFFVIESGEAEVRRDARSSPPSGRARSWARSACW